MTMQIHELKCWPDFFDAVERGDKTFELRKNDRGFQTGDVLVLQCWNPKDERYVYDGGWGGRAITNRGVPSGIRSIRVTVTYVLSSEHLMPGYVALGIKLCDSVAAASICGAR